MRFVIVTGISGAGKSTALKFFEDMGYFCVDNLPIGLIKKFAELSVTSSDYNTNDIAIGIDIRSGKGKILLELQEVLKELNDNNHSYEILFLDADDTTLIKRYKETRRIHPLAANGCIEEGISEERKELEFLSQKADYFINTSRLLTRDLKKELESIFKDHKEYNNIFITIMSFGFKYGIPVDADLVFDVRFLPNPFYEEDLKHKTGEDEEVRDFVNSSENVNEFMEKLIDMIKFLITNYINEGRSQLNIAMGCTGGKHRSVTIANNLYEALSIDANYGIKLLHKDINK